MNDKSPSSTDNLVSNLINIVYKCNSFGMMDLFILEWLLTKDTHTLLL